MGSRTRDTGALVQRMKLTIEDLRDIAAQLEDAQRRQQEYTVYLTRNLDKLPFVLDPTGFWVCEMLGIEVRV